jgi:putative Mg2+ transporter-C (MgtC) family protein
VAFIELVIIADILPCHVIRCAMGRGESRMSEVLQEIGTAIADEFSDIPDVGELTRLTVRLLIAALLGGLLGLQREHQGKAAGLRTHILVAVGSAIFMIIPMQIGVQPAELTRVIQGMVTGVGFLGAGTILKAEAEHRVKGLTTAAGIWMTSAIGMTAGLGQEMSAIACTLLALVVFAILPRLVRASSNERD